jgi:hypothetical protein
MDVSTCIGCVRILPCVYMQRIYKRKALATSVFEGGRSYSLPVPQNLMLDERALFACVHFRSPLALLATPRKQLTPSRRLLVSLCHTLPVVFSMALTAYFAKATSSRYQPPSHTLSKPSSNKRSSNAPAPLAARPLPAIPQPTPQAICTLPPKFATQIQFRLLPLARSPSQLLAPVLLRPLPLDPGVAVCFAVPRRKVRGVALEVGLLLFIFFLFKWMVVTVREGAGSLWRGMCRHALQAAESRNVQRPVTIRCSWTNLGLRVCR